MDVQRSVASRVSGRFLTEAFGASPNAGNTSWRLSAQRPATNKRSSANPKPRKVTLCKGDNGAVRGTLPGMNSYIQKFSNSSNPMPSPTQFKANATDRHVRLRESNASPVKIAYVTKWKLNRNGVLSSIVLKSPRTPAPKNRTIARFNQAGGLTSAWVRTCFFESLHASHPPKALQTGSPNPPVPN